MFGARVTRGLHPALREVSVSSYTNVEMTIMVSLTTFLRILHLQHAPPTAFKAFIPTRARVPRGPRRPDENEVAEEAAEPIELESNTPSYPS
jgi:hypothetical protein